jgi:pyruvate kinase
MEYDIIATLGPASTVPPLWQEMVLAGVTGFRLNTAHLGVDSLAAWDHSLQPFIKQHGMCLYLDLQGSKWRLGEFPTFSLLEGRIIELVLADSTTLDGALPTPHSDFFTAAEYSDGFIVLNDGKVHLQAEKIETDRMQARVTRGGEISSNKGLTVMNSPFRIEKLGEKDRQIIELTRSRPEIRYAISYIKDSTEMAHYRELIGPEAYLAAKLERGPAIEDSAGISSYANSLWLCRGDLGAELGLRSMAEAVYSLLNRVHELPVPLFLAGQIFEHLTQHPTPTRSEVCNLYEALQRGVAGCVLSDETAIGRNPLEACRAAALWR